MGDPAVALFMKMAQDQANAQTVVVHDRRNALCLNLAVDRHDGCPCAGDFDDLGVIAQHSGMNNPVHTTLAQHVNQKAFA